MATTIEAAFAELRARLEITDRQASLVAERRANVTNVLQEKLTLDPAASPTVIGSWDRNTLIAPLSKADVDLLVVLNKREHKRWLNAEGTLQALDRIKAILDEAYPATAKRRDRNCITMQFSEFRLDIVPAFRSTSLLEYPQYHYEIPDSIRQRWVDTNPHKLAKRITEVNQKMQGTFVPLIKMVKGWNRAVHGPLRGIHIEALLYHRYEWSLDRLGAWYYDYAYAPMLRGIFAGFSEALKQPCYEPVAWDKLDDYLDNEAQKTNRKIAIEKAKEAAEIARNACRERDPGTAMGWWRKLFGDAFPAYG